MRRIPWISVLGRAIIAAALVVAIFSLTQTGFAQAAADGSQALFSIVTSNTSSEIQRQNAARQLVDAGTPDSIQLVKKGLRANVSADTRQAFAKAISLSSQPSADWIDSLAATLGPNRAQNKMAAQALTAYSGKTPAFSRLKSFVNALNNPEPSRTDAIRTLGALIDKEPAEYLVELVGSNQSKNIRDAAADALVQMTGISSYGSSATQWRQWWAGVAVKTPEQFHAMLLESRGPEEAHMRQLQDDALKLTNDFYYSEPSDAKKSAMILKYLNADSPTIRQNVVGLVLADQAQAANAEVINRLVEMFGDSDEQVRVSVVNVLQNVVSDPAKVPRLLPALIDRLKVEKSPQLKIKIATALGKFADPKAVPAMLQMLKDTDADAAGAAAKALSGTLGANLHRDNPEEAKSASAAIRKILADNQDLPADLRAAFVSALGALQDPGSFDDLMNNVNNDSIEVKRAALQGLARLANKRASDRVMNRLNDGEDPSVRLEAARTLGSVASTADDHAIDNRMVREQDPRVRDALWESLQRVFDQMDSKELDPWPGIFDTPTRKEPDKHLVALMKLANALATENNSDELANKQQDIAAAMMVVTPARKQEAIDNLKKALNHWRNPGNGGVTDREGSPRLSQIIKDLLEDLLSAGQYHEAAEFAAAQISASEKYQDWVGPPLKNEVDRLSTADPAAAKTLIDEVMKMSPPLVEHYLGQIKTVQRVMNRPGP